MSITIIMAGHKDWYSLKGGTDGFEFRINHSSAAVLSLADAADRNAKLIAERYPRLWLGLSGGYDSEFVADVLVRCEIAFTPVIMTDINKTESDYAINLCRRNQKDPILLNKKPQKIYEDIARRLRSRNAAAGIIIDIAHAAESAGAALIVASGECYEDRPYPEIMGDTAVLYERDFFLELLRGDRHPGAFFCYTPEMLVGLIDAVDTDLPTQEAKSLAYDLPFRSKIFSSLPYVDVVHKTDHHDFGNRAKLRSLLVSEL